MNEQQANQIMIHLQNIKLASEKQAAAQERIATVLEQYLKWMQQA